MPTKKQTSTKTYALSFLLLASVWWLTIGIIFGYKTGAGSKPKESTFYVQYNHTPEPYTIESWGIDSTSSRSLVLGQVGGLSLNELQFLLHQDIDTRQAADYRRGYDKGHENALASLEPKYEAGDVVAFTTKPNEPFTVIALAGGTVQLSRLGENNELEHLTAPEIMVAPYQNSYDATAERLWNNWTSSGQE